MLGRDWVYHQHILHGLVILNHFKGQITQKTLNLLEEYHLMYVLVPVSCTDRLKPLGVSVNRYVKQFMQENLRIGMLVEQLFRKIVSER